MMRAALILAGAGTLAAIELGTPPRTTKAVNEPLTQSTIGTSNSRDTLTKADRLDIAHIPNDGPTQPISSVERAPPANPTPGSQEALKILNRHWHDPSTKKSAAVSPGRRIKSEEPKKSRNVDGAKATVDLRRCRRPEGFAGLLRALNLSSGCDT
jgi:hypothetical protein